MCHVKVAPPVANDANYIRLVGYATTPKVNAANAVTVVGAVFSKTNQLRYTNHTDSTTNHADWEPAPNIL